jgi:hypothetical protein
VSTFINSGSEYGLETRALCCAALEDAHSPQAPDMRKRAGRFAAKLLEGVRDGELRKAFKNRAVVRVAFGEDLQVGGT